MGWNFCKSTNTPRSNFWKKKWKSKIYFLRIMKTPLLYHLNQTSWQSMHKWRSYRTSNFTLMQSGLKFSMSTNTLRPNFLKKKIKWKSKIYFLRIMKTPLLYHLNQTSWQYMHKWRSFKTSMFTLMLSGLKCF